MIATSSDPNSFHDFGLGWRDSASNKIEYMLFSMAANSQGYYLIQQLSDINNYHNNVRQTYYSAFPVYPTWVQITDDGTNISYGFSYDGVNFQILYKAAKAGSYLDATGYNQFVFIVSNGSWEGSSPGQPSYTTIMSWRIS